MFFSDGNSCAFALVCNNERSNEAFTGEKLNRRQLLAKWSQVKADYVKWLSFIDVLTFKIHFYIVVGAGCFMSE